METAINRRSLLASLISSLGIFRPSGLTYGQEPSRSADAQRKSYTLRKFTAPFYPVMARQVDIEGRATLVAHIAKDGKVSDATDSSGNSLFQAAVSEAVREWQFDAPTEQMGQLRITFQFFLKGNPDQRILSYKVSGTLPDYFEIQANPFGANP